MQADLTSLGLGFDLDVDLDLDSLRRVPRLGASQGQLPGRKLSQPEGSP